MSKMIKHFQNCLKCQTRQSKQCKTLRGSPGHGMAEFCKIIENVKKCKTKFLQIRIVKNSQNMKKIKNLKKFHTEKTL